MSALAPDLAHLQQWMLAVITDPGGVEVGNESERARAALEAGGDRPAPLGALVCDLPDLSASESLMVYARMYFERLIGTLSDHYPAVRAFLGERWRGVARAYVTSHASTFRSLNDYGADFDEHVASTVDGATEGAFLAELARLELGVRRLWRAPHVPVLSVDDFLAVPQTEWPEHGLPLVPSVTLYAFDYPTERAYRAWKNEQRIEVPEARATWAVSWYRDERAWRRELSREAYTILTELAAGRPLGAAIEAVTELEDADLEAVAAGLTDWFREWCSEGFFRAPGV